MIVDLVRHHFPALALALRSDQFAAHLDRRAGGQALRSPRSSGSEVLRDDLEAFSATSRR